MDPFEVVQARRLITMAENRRFMNFFNLRAYDCLNICFLLLIIFIISGDHKLRNMCSSGLRSIPHEELKALCLKQLEGMSKKRIKNVLVGKLF